jgi:hypothetical protein
VASPAEIAFLLTRVSPSSEDAQEPALCEVDPNLTVRFAHRSVDDTFTVTPKDTPRDKEGRQ